MRNFLCLTLSFMIIIACVPAVSLFYKDEVLTKTESSLKINAAVSEKESGEKAQAKESEKPATTEKNTSKVTVLLHKSGKTVKVTRLFYIISVLAKEIDISSPDEALKAQAVCIQTFLKRTSQSLKDKKYDISDDSSVHQSFLTSDELKKFWGDNYDKNYKKLEKIAKSVEGLYLSYNSQTALAAYHSSNAGRTESAENYWGQKYDYLSAVESPGDKLCKDYKNKFEFSPKELKKKLKSLKQKQFIFPDSPSDWIGSKEITPSGTVKALEIAGVNLSGREIREALGLKSSFFEIEYLNGSFVFTVSGYGHGVGMSQEGAKYMAKLGFDYKAILTHYYKGVEILSENKL